MDNDFEAFLARVINAECTDSEEEAFRDKYIYTEAAEDFPYVKKATERGYAAAYAPLADYYAEGRGCSEDWEKAFHYWSLSVQNQWRGYAMIGDCYRLGKGTDKNYDKAWDAYENAAQRGEERNNDDGPSVKELLLTSEDWPSIEGKLIEIDWLNYAIKKQTKAIPSYLYHDIASLYFKPESEEYVSWLKMGAEAGDIGAKCSLVEVTKDAVEREKLIREILTLENFWNNAEAVGNLAKSVIDDNVFEEQAFQLLWETEESEESKWLFDHYREQKRENDLERLLCMAERESEDWLPKHLRSVVIPDGYFQCPSCGHIRSLDESNPDRQGEICNKCYQLGNYHR